MAGFNLVVRIAFQEADLYQGSRLVRTYRISSALNGPGCEAGSCKTPVGLLRVARKIGAGCATGTVFRGREATGEVWSSDPGNPLRDSTEDLVLSRILWLEGLEAHNANTLDRYIYLHGTNQEHLLGQAVSHGCIRLSNRDVEELFDLVPEGTLVEILG
jgi:hypothetical protein